MEEPLILQSAVRVPTPPPQDVFPSNSTGKRKRSPTSSSSSPRRRRSPGFADRTDSGTISRAVGTERVLPEMSRPLVRQKVLVKEPTAEEKQAAAKTEYEKLVNARSGGVYIPPARLRALQAQITDTSSKEYQRMAWEALKKSINGLINKVNVSNIKHIVPELFGENLIRGRGLFCRSIMKAQAASPPFTLIYAATVSIINSKLPKVGELLVTRLIVQFKKAFKRNDKSVCLSSTTFIAHLVNQQIVHETLCAEILLLLLKRPTDDSVEIAVGLTREVGQHLEEMSGPVALLVFDQFRNILHEHDLDKRVQYMIEVLFQVRKDKFKDNPAIRDELDLVEEEDQITHQIDLDDEMQTQDSLNIFKYDENWEENEDAYTKIKAEILGEASGSEQEDEDEDGSDDSSEDEEGEKEREMEIKDQTNTALVNLRRQIYLTIMSSIDFEECCHKLMRVNFPPGQEPELPSMIIECCSQERTYSKFYGLIGERFSKLNRTWSELFEASFAKYYDTIHRYEANRLRNIARFFGHMLSSNALDWHVLSIIHLNEDETTSSSRIFIKILFQDLSESLGLPKLRSRLAEDLLKSSFEGIFPRENPRNIRFSINYFTSIGMGALTEEMREQLKNLPKSAAPALPAAKAQSESDTESVSSYSSYTSSSRSYSRSRSPSRARGRGKSYSRSPSRTPPRRQPRRQSYSPPASRSVSPPARGRQRSRSYSSRSVSRSPAPRGRGRPRDDHRRSYSSSRSPSPLPSRRRDVQGRQRTSSSISPAPKRGYHERRGHSSNSPSPRRPNQRREGRRSISRLSPPTRVRETSSSPETQNRARSSAKDSALRRGNREVTKRGPRGGRPRAEDYL